MYSKLVIVCASIHGETTKAFPARKTKIKLIPFSAVYAVGELEGKEGEYWGAWLKATDLEKAGVNELGCLTEPGKWLTDFHELEDKLDLKQKKLRLFFWSRGQNSQ